MKIIEKSKFYEDLSVGFQMCEELWKFSLCKGVVGGWKSLYHPNKALNNRLHL
jgi:hypothetical protein